MKPEVADATPEVRARESKVEAVRLIKERGVAVAQAARDLDVHENVLRKWVKELSGDPAQAFPGAGQMKPDQLEIDRLRREVSKLKAERDIPKRPLPTSRGSRYEVRLHIEAPIRLAGGVAMRSLGRLAVGLSRLAQPTSQRTGFDGRGHHAEGPRKLRREFPDLRRAACLAGCLAVGVSCSLHKIERLMRGEALRARPRRRGLPKDEGERLISPASKRPRSRVQCGAAEPEVDCRLHLHLDGRGLALCGGRY